MKKLLLSLCVALLTPICGVAQDVLPLIPQPQNLTLRTGTFKMPKKVRVYVPAYENDSVQGVVDRFAAQLQHSFGLEMKAAVTPKRCHIELRINPNIHDEGYRLEVEQESVLLEASCPAGFFYGFQTDSQKSVFRFVRIGDQTHI